jgi:hypothetical protein
MYYQAWLTGLLSCSETYFRGWYVGNKPLKVTIFVRECEKDEGSCVVQNVRYATMKSVGAFSLKLNEIC